MKKYIAVLEIEDDEEIIDAKVTYFYSSNGMTYKATEKMELEEDKIGIGDEVIDKNEWGIRGIVTEISERCISIVENDGSVSRWKKDEFNKTGRHYPQIEEMLKQMKENE